MGFAKYFEDNMEVIEERLMLRQQSIETIPSSNLCQATCIIKNQPEHMQSRKKTKKKTKLIICCDCGSSIIFTGGEQKYYEQHHLCEPRRCARCRNSRKEMFQAIRMI